MDEMEETKRFDVEKVEYDTDGTPIIPRINFTVPRSYRKQFYQDMVEEVRATPGEQLMAIFVKYMRMRQTQLAVTSKVPPGGEQRQIPVLGGPQSLLSKVVLDKQGKSGA